MKYTHQSYLKLVILDCDGVLVDSFRSNVAFYNHLMKELDEPPLNPEAEHLSQVYSTPQLLQELFSNAPEKVAQGLKIARELDYLPFLDYLDPKPGLFETLKTLGARYRLALATNRGTSLGPLLKKFNLEETFEVTATIQTVTNPKPAPDMLLYCLRETGVAACQAVYVGDMDNDRISAEAAGIPFILMGNAFDYQPKIQELDRLPKLLEEGFIS